MPVALPAPVRRLVRTGAVPDLLLATFERLVAADPDRCSLLAEGDEPTDLAVVIARAVEASNLFARLLVRDPRAVDVLAHLDRAVPLPPDAARHPAALADWHDLAMLRIAARDLVGLDDLTAVGRQLSTVAATALGVAADAATLPSAGLDDVGGARSQPRTAAERAAASSPPPGHLPTAGTSASDRPEVAVIGMGKLGGSELNYTSDVDVLLVGGPAAGDEVGRRLLRTARGCFRVDTDLRPEGRSGPLMRNLDGYRSYWERWARPWERQALLKARPVAGDEALGSAFADAADAEVWAHRFTAEELASIRAMKARTESLLDRRGLRHRDVKRGAGGIRDVEFAVQLLQLVHGRLDPTIRSRTTLTALAQLAGAGYVAADDAIALADGYRFLRTVEHRLQLVEGEQAHVVPTDPAAAQRLARVLGFTDGSDATAAERFGDALRRQQAAVRSVHERLYFRPLLEAFATLPDTVTKAGGRAAAVPTTGGPTTGTTTDGPTTGTTTDGPAVARSGDGMSPEAVTARLDAFGFAGADRTRDAVAALVNGLTRSSRLMRQMLPLVLDWLSQGPDPDLGLQQLRDVVVHHHQRSAVVSLFRDSPEAARRLCLLLGTSRLLGEAFVRSPDLLASLRDDEALAPLDRSAASRALGARLQGRRTIGDQREQMARFVREQRLRITVQDVLGLADVPATAAALTAGAEAALEAAMALTGPDQPWCAVGLGRFGGAELSYASDLDLVLVCEHEDPGTAAAGEALLALFHGSGAYQAVARVDVGLRPEGGQGRLVRDLDGYHHYFERWAQTWERQAMLRARVVAGDRELGERFMALAGELAWGRPFTATDVADVRRMKARIERERVSPHEDARFHLKLGPGALADVEWTVQLLQLRHRVPEPGTMRALDRLAGLGVVSTADAEHLRSAYRYCEHTRNRWHLVGALAGGGSPGDALPTRRDQLGRLARSLATTPAELRADYRRVTRRARAVVERIFYEMPEAR